MLKRLSILIILFFLGTINVYASPCPDTLDFEFKKLASPEKIHLCEAFSGQVLLVVNTASKCGYTYQYDGLEALYKKYKDQGLVVLGFPSNDFANQEPGSDKQIHSFCRLTYGVNFPMFSKSHVARGKANPLYKHYASLTGVYPRWNFHKFLVDRKGKIIGNFRSTVEPNDPKLVAMIEKSLSEPN